MPPREARTFSTEQTSSVTTVASNTSFVRNWQLAGIVGAIVVNVGWVGFLGYVVFKLIEPVLFE
jgi:hypothetical protein